MTSGDLKIFGTAQLVFTILLSETVHREYSGTEVDEHKPGTLSEGADAPPPWP